MWRLSVARTTIMRDTEETSRRPNYVPLSKLSLIARENYKRERCACDCSLRIHFMRAQNKLFLVE